MMADISIAQSPAAPALQVRTQQTVTPDIPKGAVSETAEQKEREAVRTEQEIENVVSVSEDGDTVQVSEEGATRLQENSSVKDAVEKAPVFGGQPIDTTVTVEGKVAGDVAGTVVDESRTTADPNGTVVDDNKAAGGVDENEEVPLAVTSGTTADEKNVIIVPADREPVEGPTTDQESDVPQVSSYAGYSDSQLEQLYLKGDISKFDYDQEMEAREEERKAQQEKDTGFSTDMTEHVQQQEQAEQDAASIQSAFSPDASKVLEATDRVNIVATLQNIGL